MRKERKITMDSWLDMTKIYIYTEANIRVSVTQSSSFSFKLPYSEHRGYEAELNLKMWQCNDGISRSLIR